METHLNKPTHRNDVLKFIAIITMLIDHIGVVLLPDIFVLREIGRIAFPIFAYQVAQGYRFTSNRAAYVGRLSAFALIAYLPYMYLSPNLEPRYFELNIMFTLLLGVLAMFVWDKTQGAFRDKSIGRGVFYRFLFIATLVSPLLIQVTFAGTPMPLRVSYGIYGVVIIILFYWFGRQPLVFLASFLIMSLGTTYISGALAYMNAASPRSISQAWYEFYKPLVPGWNTTLDTILSANGGLSKLSGYFFQMRSIYGVMIIFWLQDKAFSFRLHRMVAYWFYPVHMAVLVLLRYGELHQWWTLF